LMCFVLCIATCFKLKNKVVKKRSDNGLSIANE
jgi:hypothetical protein